MHARVARGVTLTDAGGRFLVKVQAALDLLEQAVQEVKEAPKRDVLRLSVIPTLAMRWLIPRLPQFHARRPDLRITLKPYGTRSVARGFQGLAAGMR